MHGGHLRLHVLQKRLPGLGGEKLGCSEALFARHLLEVEQSQGREAVDDKEPVVGFPGDGVVEERQEGQLLEGRQDLHLQNTPRRAPMEE